MPGYGNNADLFFRVNRSLIVSIGCVNQIEPYFGNRLALKLKPNFERETIVSHEKVMLLKFALLNKDYPQKKASQVKFTWDAFIKCYQLFVC
jgi:hypothetical protein